MNMMHTDTLPTGTDPVDEEDAAEAEAPEGETDVLACMEDVLLA